MTKVMTRWSLVGLALLLSLTVVGMSATTAASRQETTTVKVGYLHTPAVDVHLWLGMQKGYYEKHGIILEPQQFNSGPPLAQALAGGSIDVAIMGAVISNFPSRGQGKVFLINDVERNTAQLWVAADSGINAVTDLSGKSVATTQGTTAHVFLQTALEANQVDPSSVEIVNFDMPGAVNAFISGAVPAVVLWSPFELQVQEQRPDAKLVDSANTYYPESAIVGGWVANNDFYENEKETLAAITRGWLEANTDLTSDPAGSLQIVHEAAYSENMSLEQLTYIFEQEEVFTNQEWADRYADGTVAEWIGRVEQVFVDIGAFPDFVEPSEFFDPQIYLDTFAAMATSTPEAATPAP